MPNQKHAPAGVYSATNFSDAYSATDLIDALANLCVLAQIGLEQVRAERHGDFERNWNNAGFESLQKEPRLSAAAWSLLFEVAARSFMGPVGHRDPMPLDGKMPPPAVELHKFGLVAWLTEGHRVTYTAADARALEPSLAGRSLYMRHAHERLSAGAKAELAYLGKQSRLIGGRRRGDEKWVMAARELVRAGAARFFMCSGGVRNEVDLVDDSYTWATELDITSLGARILGTIGKKSPAQTLRKQPKKRRAAARPGKK